LGGFRELVDTVGKYVMACKQISDNSTQLIMLLIQPVLRGANMKQFMKPTFIRCDSKNTKEKVKPKRQRATASANHKKK
jgi:hypothetical protein